MSTEECVFCRIVAGELPCQKVWESEAVLAFRDINPSAPVHVVVIPKQHVAANLGEVSEKDSDTLAKLQLAAAQVAKNEGISEFSFKTNTGRSAGQSVWHLHYHLQGGWKGGEN